MTREQISPRKGSDKAFFVSEIVYSSWRLPKQIAISLGRRASQCGEHGRVIHDSFMFRRVLLACNSRDSRTSHIPNHQPARSPVIGRLPGSLFPATTRQEMFSASERAPEAEDYEPIIQTALSRSSDHRQDLDVQHGLPQRSHVGTIPDRGTPESFLTSFVSSRFQPCRVSAAQDQSDTLSHHHSPATG